MSSTADITTVEQLVRHRLAQALGGRRGIFETAAPIVAFTVSWIVSEDLRNSLIIAVGTAVILLVVRIVSGGSTQFVLNAALGIAIAAFVASRTGDARDVFLPGIIINAIEAAVFSLSILLRWPVVGFMIGAATGELTEWRKDPAVLRLCSWLTVPLAASFAIRAAVLYPLWAANEVALLGVAKLALGWPLALAAFAVMAWLLGRNHTPLEQSP